MDRRPIAEAVGISRATTARTLRLPGLVRLGPAGADVRCRRYEWMRPGQLLHLEMTNLGWIGHVGHRITGDRRQRSRGIAWEFVHVGVDDCSRIVFVEVLPDESGASQ